MATLLSRVVRRIRTRLAPAKASRHGFVGSPLRWEMKRQFQIDFLQGQGLAPSNTLIDIGCGTLRGGIPLISYLDAGKYYGIESRPEVLEEGRAELSEEGLVDKVPNLFACDDMTALTIDARFDYAWAFSVLFHMSDEIIPAAFDLVGRHLGANGAFYANVNLGEQAPGSWQGFPVVWRTLEDYAALGAANGLTVEVLGTLADFGHHSGVADQDGQPVLKFTRA